jgi:hypothetical protein
MRKLLAVGAIGIALSLPTISLAETSVFGVQVPVVKSQVKEEVRGGNVEKDFVSFYTTPKTRNATGLTPTVNQTSNDEDYYIVFGVRIPRDLGS